VTDLRLKITEDGSHTLFVPGLSEHYHSTHGALQEAEIVYLRNGFQYIAGKVSEVNVLEIGFGTGLNALLTVLEAKKRKQMVRYVGVEPEPLPPELLAGLNFADQIGGTEAEGYFRKMHAQDWEQPRFLSDYFILNKIRARLEDLTLGSGKFHLIYFDAFGPDVQPELWTTEIFAKMAQCLLPDGVLVTYSCKGSVKRALKAAGFSIGKLPGPAGKREVLRAVKIPG
jgi:tRNA U34 5-methylaminomethyl-2-thiouridine-forming methyltransferase MnmC